MPETVRLSDDETLTFLHGCASTKRHGVRAREVPAYLDALLATSLAFGGRCRETGVRPSMGSVGDA